MSFDTIPILDLARARDPALKPGLLADLRRAVLEVGFLYIGGTGIDPALTAAVVAQCHAFFALPEPAKQAIEMRRAPSFLGYSRLGNETTAHRTDLREQLDLSTPHPLPGPGAPRYHHLRAPNQWPAPAELPAFRPTLERYMAALAALAADFTRLIAEALDLPADAFDRFFDTDQQHKLKLVKYPDRGALPPGAVSRSGGGAASDGNGGAASDGNGGAGDADDADDTAQGVGPHKDSMLTSYLLQASGPAGLQAQNRAGRWVDCPARAGTLVVALGQGLEALTRGACAATAHRVRSPPRGAGPRFSVPFFQGVSYDATFESVAVPEAVLAEKARFLERVRREEGGAEGREEEVEFTFVKGRWKHLGEATLWNRCKSHPDVAERWYPDIWAAICEERRREGRVAEARLGEAEADAGNAAAGDAAAAKLIEAH